MRGFFLLYRIIEDALWKVCTSLEDSLVAEALLIIGRNRRD